MPNVHFLGVLPVDEVRHFVTACDVCLIPYRVTDETRAINSLKLYEYLAAGKPVVSAPVPAAEEHLAVVRLADRTVEAWATDVEAARAASDDPQRVAARLAVAAANLRNEPMRRIEGVLEALKRGALGCSHAFRMRSHVGSWVLCRNVILLNTRSGLVFLCASESGAVVGSTIAVAWGRPFLEAGMPGENNKPPHSEGKPWWVVAIPVALALVVLAYQAFTPIRLNRYQVRQTITVTDSTTASSRELTLAVLYPRKLLLDETPDSGRPIHVWLSDPQPNQPPITYTLVLTPSGEGLTFTDHNGIPVLPSIDLAVSRLPLESGSWLLHRSPGARLIPGSVILKPIVRTKLGASLEVEDSEIKIRLESSPEALLRRYRDLVCGPTTPLMALAITLTAWLWNDTRLRREREETHRKELEDENRRRFEQELAELEMLWSVDHEIVILRYLDLGRKVQAHGDESLAGKPGGIHTYVWQNRLEQVAIESVARGNYALAHKLQRVLCLEMGGTANSEGVENSTSPTSYAGLDSDKDNLRQVCDILRLIPDGSPSPEAKVRSLVALAASRGDLLEESLVPALAQTFADVLPEDGVIVQAVISLSEKSDAQWLVSSPQVRQQLERVTDSAPDHQASIQLMRRAFERIKWQSLWQAPHATRPSEEGIKEVLAARGWVDNPFGPDRVEDETRSLDGLWVEPSSWDALNVPGPVILQSESGYGQSFALRYLLWGYGKQWSEGENGSSTAGPRVFPALLNQDALLLARTRRESVSEIAFGVGQALIHFLALNSHLFDQSALTERLAVARLCLACEFRLGNLREYLRHYLNQHDQPDSLVPDWLTQTMRETAAAAQPVSLTNSTDVLVTLAQARLAGSQGFVVAVDIPARNPDLRRAQLLVDLIPDLVRSKIDLNLGLPANSGLRTQAIPHVRLEAWPRERLEALLRKRLDRAEGFANLANPDVDLEEWVVSNASGSPQRLVQLGNHLLAFYGSRRPQRQLSPKDLDEVLRGPDQRPVAIT